MGKRTSKKKQVNPKKIEQKKSKLGFSLSVTVIIVGFIGLALIHFNIISTDDSKIEPFQRVYVIKNITDFGIRENILPDGNKTQTTFMSSDIGGIVKMSGGIQFNTQSKSARNPIDVKVMLLPDLNTDLPVDWKDMPEKIHFVFEGAKKLSEKGSVKLDDFVEIELEKKYGDNPGYYGSEVLYYEDAGSYDFYLKEAKEQEKNVKVTEKENGRVDIQFNFPIYEESYKKGIKFFEVNKHENKKLIIEPYGQTITLNSYKLGGYLGFASLLIAGMFTLRKFY